MTTVDQIKLTHHQRQALDEIRRSLLDTFDIEKIGGHNTLFCGIEIGIMSPETGSRKLACRVGNDIM
jgi:hypothetical protein